MPKSLLVEKTIARLERMSSSASSNPRYIVHFTDGAAMPTVEDGAVGYGIGNPEYKDAPVTLTLNARGHIVGIVDANGQHPLGSVRVA